MANKDDSVYVSGYTRADGTEVSGYVRSAPNGDGNSSPSDSGNSDGSGTNTNNSDTSNSYEPDPKIKTFKAEVRENNNLSQVSNGTQASNKASGTQPVGNSGVDWKGVGKTILNTLGHAAQIATAIVAVMSRSSGGYHGSSSSQIHSNSHKSNVNSSYKIQQCKAKLNNLVSNLKQLADQQKANLENLEKQVVDNHKLWPQYTALREAHQQTQQQVKSLDYMVKSNDYQGIAKEFGGYSNTGNQTPHNSKSSQGQINRYKPEKNIVSIPKVESGKQQEIWNWKTGVISNDNPYNSSVLNKSLYQAASEGLARNMMGLKKTNDFMQNSISNLENQINNSDVKVIRNVDNKAINKLLGLKGPLEISQDWRGIVYSPNSGLTKDIINSKDLHTYIKKYYNDVKSGKMPDKSFIMNSTTDFMGSINKITVINPTVDKNGNFSAILFDKYDFDFKMKPNDYQPNPKLIVANNIADILQGTKELKGYYILVPIKLQKDQISKILKK